MPNLKTKGSQIQLDEQTHKHWVQQLEEELEGMFLEYKYMKKLDNIPHQSTPLTKSFEIVLPTTNH